MSQGSQGAFAAGRTILPLAKFSYASVHGESKTPIPWSHISRSDNLFAIFESQRVEDSRGQTRDVKKFKVINDPEILEDIDLDILAIEAKRAKAEAQSPMKNDKLITVIIKMPCIAIRYPLQGGRIRRIQIRLTSNEDYFETLKLLSRADVPVGEAGSFPTQPQQARPFSSSSSMLRPSDSASQLGPRPASVSSRIGNPSSVRGDKGIEWTSSTHVRPPTSSGLANGTVPGEISEYFGQSSRTYGLLNNPKMHFSDAPPSMGPTSGLVSGYFGELANLPSFHPQPAVAQSYIASPGRIDLYQPRPSTAPMSISHNPSYMLPPKRELPFPVPAVAKKTRMSSARTTEVQEETDPEPPNQPSPSLPDFSKLRNSVLDAVSAMETKSEVSINSSAPVPATKGKRAITAKAPKPRAPKKQPAKAPAKKAAKAGKEKEIVPGINQLLKEAYGQSKNAMVFPPTIDTQDLLARVDTTKLYQSIGLPDTMKEVIATVSEISPPSSQTNKCICCRTRKGKCNGQNPCDWCIDQNLECTFEEASVNPASRVLVPSSQPEVVAEAPRKASPAVNDTAARRSPEVAMEKEAVASQQNPVTQEAITAGESITRQSPPQKYKPPQLPAAPPSDTNTTPINAAPSSQTAVATQALHLVPAASTDPFSLLLGEAAFAPSHQLTLWSDLPECEQRTSLETWICQQISDPGFAALLRRMDESWQGSLLGRGVGMNS